MRTNRCLSIALLVGYALLGSPAFAGGLLTRGIGNEPDSLDPHLASGTSSSIVLYDLFEGLVTVDAAGHLTPGCAENWTVDADARGIVFKLRANLRWSDGKALTAADFEYSLRRLLAPETAARFASFLYPIKSARAVNTGRAPPTALGVRALDERTLRLEFGEAAPQMLEVLSGIAAAPVPRHAIERDGREWTRPGKMVSNGAFALESVVPRASVQVRRNAQFHAAASVALDGVRYLPIEDEGASLRRFQTGELHVAVRFPVDKVDSVRAQLGANLHRTASFGSNMLLLNMRDPALADQRLRRALSLALDRDVLARRVLRGTGVPSFALVPEAISDYPSVTGIDSVHADDATMSSAQRQTQARALTAAAPRPAQPLRLLYPADGKSRSLAIAMLSMWRAAGIAVEIQSQDLTSVIAAARSGQYQMALYAWFSSFDDPVTYLDLLTSKGGRSLTGYTNPLYDRKFQAANVLRDAAQRGAALKAAEALALADYPVIPLFNSVNLRLVSGRVSGWIDNPRGANLSRYLDLRP